MFAREEYDKNTQEQINNELRLYHNRVNNYLNTLADTNGGSALSFPHIVAYDDADQEADGDDTATQVKFTELSDNVGFVLNADNTATALHDGTYKVEYRLQAVNTDNVAHNATVWLRVNDEDVAYSATEFTIPARKSASEFAYVTMTSFVSWEAQADQKFALFWATETAYDSGASTDGVYLQAQAAQTSPFARPAIPSASGIIQYIGRE